MDIKGNFNSKQFDYIEVMLEACYGRVDCMDEEDLINQTVNFVYFSARPDLQNYSYDGLQVNYKQDSDTYFNIDPSYR